MQQVYDAIFKNILETDKSEFLSIVARVSVAKPLPTGAGWYTGRSADYLGQVTELSYVHMEVQTANDSTMHWRMVNYFLLLNHKLHNWETDAVRIKQFLVYIGNSKLSMLPSHPKFGIPYEYTTVSLKDATYDELLRSNYFGDWVIWLLTIRGRDKDNWKKIFDRICCLQDYSSLMEGLFILREMSNLRGMQRMVDDELEQASLGEALLASPVSKIWAERTAITAVAGVINRHLANVDEQPLTDDEMEQLLDEGLNYAQSVCVEIGTGRLTRADVFRRDDLTM